MPASWLLAAPRGQAARSPRRHSHSRLCPPCLSRAGSQVSDFELKLMDIDGEHLAIPETEYTSKIAGGRAVFWGMAL